MIIKYCREGAVTQKWRSHVLKFGGDKNNQEQRWIWHFDKIFTSEDMEIPNYILQIESKEQRFREIAQRNDTNTMKVLLLPENQQLFRSLLLHDSWVERDLFHVSATIGFFDLLKFLLTQDLLDRNDEGYCVCAAAYGHLEILKWLREHQFSWNGWVTFWAKYYNHVEIFEWAKDNGCSYEPERDYIPRVYN